MNIWQPLPLVVKNSSSFSIHLFDSLSHQLYAIFPGCVRHCRSPLSHLMKSAPCCLDAGCMQAPKTKDPDSSQKRYPDSREMTAPVAWCVGHWIQPAAWCPNSRSPQQKSCSPHASCWHPAPNTQTRTRGNVQMSRPQTSLVLHMLHVGIQHQTPIFQPEEMSRQQTSHQSLNTNSSQRKWPDNKESATSALPRLVCWSLFI